MLKPILVAIFTRLQLRFMYRFRTVGKSVRLGRSLYVYKNRVSVGNNVYIGQYCFLDGDIVIGDEVMLAGSVAIVGGDHAYKTVGKSMFAAEREHWRTTHVENEVWIGHGAIILNGIRIGRGAVVAAGSVVTRNVAPYSIVAGNPAKEIGERFSPDLQIVHEHIRAGR